MPVFRSFLILGTILLAAACGKDRTVELSRSTLPTGALLSWNNDNKQIAVDFADREVETQFATKTTNEEIFSKECAWKQIVVVHEYEEVRKAIAAADRTNDPVMKSLISITAACFEKHRYKGSAL